MKKRRKNERHERYDRESDRLLAECREAYGKRIHRTVPLEIMEECPFDIGTHEEEDEFWFATAGI